MNMTLTDRQKTILQQRNNWVVCEGHPDAPELDAMVQAGYMTVQDYCMGSAWLYQATDRGREALGLPPA